MHDPCKSLERDLFMATTTANSSPLPNPDQEREEPRLRRYAIASFDNLVVLANYEEHLREARKMVWRDRGEPAVEVYDLWECLEHGTRGGLRTFIPSTPSCINLNKISFDEGLFFRFWDPRFCHSLWSQSHPFLGAHQEFA
jgi:hypothetical protein